MAKKAKAKEAAITPEQSAIAQIESEPEVQPSEAVAGEKPKPKFDIREFLKTKKGKIWAGLVGGAVVTGLIFAIPVTRYGVLGTVIKKEVTVTVLDSVNSRPVTEATVVLAGQTATTDTGGIVKFSNVPVGSYQAQVTKKYFTDLSQSVLVPVFGGASSTLKVVATGRQVPVTILNKISGKPVQNALVSSGEADTKTDDKGEAILVVPVDQTEVDATVKTEGYNDLTVKVTVVENVSDKNKFSITPSGKIYFLSKRTGKIDVMKSNLDGTEAQVVLAGTGKEEDNNTVLLASRDWKRLALKSKREGDHAKLYYIDVSNDQTRVMDEGKASFNPVGWSGDNFVYYVLRDDKPYYSDKQQALKSYNAVSDKLTTIEETEGTGSVASHFGYPVSILDDRVAYTVVWSSNWYSYGLEGRTQAIKSAKTDGSDKRVHKTFDATKYSGINAKQYAPKELYFIAYNSPKDEFYELDGTEFSQPGDLNSDKYSKSYPIKLVSPSGQHTLWYDPRDGKNTIFVGDGNGENEKEVARLDKQISYGWYGDDYLLLAKSGSELYIMARDGSEPVKVTEYHKPYFTGYGYGYGGATDQLYDY